MLGCFHNVRSTKRPQVISFAQDAFSSNDKYYQIRSFLLNPSLVY